MNDTIHLKKKMEKYYNTHQYSDQEVNFLLTVRDSGIT
jgi:cupin superfamily acireductone dioxygenase involved in methionine salvage